MSKPPKISRVGLRGVLVTFADTLSDPGNRAAVAFRAEVDAQDWAEVQETASTLVSTFIAVDLTVVDYDDMVARLTTLLDGRDWSTVAVETDRKLWTVPMCFEPEVAPQLEDAANAAGLSLKAARAQLSGMRTRVITLGFAPGQPYLGMLPVAWDIPRQTELTPQVPIGALVVAIRQFVLFATTAPTGWRHIGQTAFRPFDPDRTVPVAFSPGDEVRFAEISASELSALEATDSLGGATWTPLT